MVLFKNGFIFKFLHALLDHFGHKIIYFAKAYFGDLRNYFDLDSLYLDLLHSTSWTLKTTLNYKIPIS
jgi:hypothetical protein